MPGGCGDTSFFAETTNPSCWSSSVAGSTGWSTTFGTATFGGPVEIVTTTVEPRGAVEPPAGLVEITAFFNTVVDTALAGETLKPSARSCAEAADSPRLRTFGTWRFFGAAGPVETSMTTVEPRFACAPAVGDCDATVPAWRAELIRCGAGMKPSARRFASASTSCSPTTGGTLSGLPADRFLSTSTKISAAIAAAATSTPSSAHGQVGPRSRRPGGSRIAPGGMIPVVLGSQ